MNRIEETVKGIKDLDSRILCETQGRLDFLTKPQGSLGRLEELAKQIAAISEKPEPQLKKKVILFILTGKEKKRPLYLLEFSDEEIVGIN